MIMKRKKIIFKRDGETSVENIYRQV